MFDVPRCLIGSRTYGCVSYPNPRTLQLRVPMALMAACLAVFLLGCGLLGGNGEGEGDGDADNPLTPRPEILTKLASVSAQGGEAAGGGETPPEPEAPAEPEPDSAPEPSVQTEEEARNLVWVHLSQCINFAASDLQATQITGDWFVKSTGESERRTGLWKVGAAAGAVEPYDVLSRQWQRVVESECSAESLSALTTPTPVPTATPAIADGARAVAVVWSYVAQCLPDTPLENFEATLSPVLNQWVVTTKAESLTDFGAWTVDAATGALAPYAGFSREWDSVVKLECNPDALASLFTPTPVPTATPAVLDTVEAVTTLWSYLVKCSPDLTTEALEATLNPAKGEWIVITKPGSETDYGVWTVRANGSISPGNQEATRRDQRALSGTC